MESLVIVGAGGFGRETIDVVRAINADRPTWSLRGVIDDQPSEVNLRRLADLGVPHLGGLASVPPRATVALAVGNPAARASLVDTLAPLAPVYPSLVHPSAVVGSHFRHGHGLIVLGGVSIGTNVSVGHHLHLNAHAVIGHDVVSEDFVSINPQATLSGEVTVGRACLVGAGSTVLQGLSLGPGCIVGAGSVVVRSVSERLTVKGVPAR